MNLLPLIATYGYLGVFLGGAIEGEMILIFGGLAARAGYLNLPQVLFFALIGALVSDFTFFYLGRYHGKAIIGRWPWLEKRMRQPQELIHKHAYWVTFVMRFMYGFRNIVPFTLGLTPIPAALFATINMLGAIVWVFVVGMSGYFFGEVMRVLLGRLRHYELYSQQKQLHIVIETP